VRPIGRPAEGYTVWITSLDSGSRVLILARLPSKLGHTVEDRTWDQMESGDFETTKCLLSCNPATAFTYPLYTCNREYKGPHGIS